MQLERRIKKRKRGLKKKEGDTVAARARPRFDFSDTEKMFFLKRKTPTF